MADVRCRPRSRAVDGIGRRPGDWTVSVATPVDFLLIALAAMLFAIALAARTWVKTQEPTAVAIRRRDETIEAWNALRSGEGNGLYSAPDDEVATGNTGTDRTG